MEEEEGRNWRVGSREEEEGGRIGRCKGGGVNGRGGGGGEEEEGSKRMR